MDVFRRGNQKHHTRLQNISIFDYYSLVSIDEVWSYFIQCAIEKLIYIIQVQRSWGALIFSWGSAIKASIGSIWSIRHNSFLIILIIMYMYVYTMVVTAPDESASCDKLDRWWVEKIWSTFGRWSSDQMARYSTSHSWTFNWVLSGSKPAQTHCTGERVAKFCLATG